MYFTADCRISGCLPWPCGLDSSLSPARRFIWDSTAMSQIHPKHIMCYKIATLTLKQIQESICRIWFFTLTGRWVLNPSSQPTIIMIGLNFQKLKVKWPKTVCQQDQGVILYFLDGPTRQHHRVVASAIFNLDPTDSYYMFSLGLQPHPQKVVGVGGTGGSNRLRIWLEP